jgi:hypothetical protein
VSEAQQATNLRRVFSLLKGSRGQRAGVMGAIWFNLIDNPNATATWFDNTGLFRRNGTSKPSWDCLKRVTGAATTGC